MKLSRLTIGFLIFLLFGESIGFAQITRDEALSMFVSAGTAYKEGRYDAAIEQYNEILKGGRESGALYYNLGNSYFKKGNLGKAFLNYERAKRFIPRDSDLNFNHTYVQSQIKYYSDDEREHPVDSIIKDYIQFYSIDEMILILAGLGMALGVLFLLSLYFPRSKSTLQGAIAFVVLAIMVYGAGLTIKVQTEKDTAIILKSAKSYFEPRTDSTVHFQLSEGMKVKILKSGDFWGKVERSDGKIGWVDLSILEKI